MNLKTTAVLVFHPRLTASSRVNARLARAAREAGAPERPIEVRDMYGLYPDFRIDVAAEHAVLEERSAADGSQWLHIRLREKHYHQIQSKYNRRLELQTHSDIP